MRCLNKPAAKFTPTDPFDRYEVQNLVLGFCHDISNFYRMAGDTTLSKKERIYWYYYYLHTHYFYEKNANNSQTSPTTTTSRPAWTSPITSTSCSPAENCPWRRFRIRSECSIWVPEQVSTSHPPTHFIYWTRLIYAGKIGIWAIDFAEYALVIHFFVWKRLTFSSEHPDAFVLGRYKH